jgi:hypothetical protein
MVVSSSKTNVLRIYRFSVKYNMKSRQVQSNLYIKDIEWNLKMCPLYASYNYMHFGIHQWEK